MAALRPQRSGRCRSRQVARLRTLPGDKAFFLEYDTDRAGGFEPLRFVPKGKTVVLGLISSKVPGLEKKDDLKRRIDAAARYVPLENLCLSPQCGFSSTHHGNTITIDDQKRKLALALRWIRCWLLAASQAQDVLHA